MFAKVNSLAVNGIEGFLVQIEVDLGLGIPAFDIVGLPDIAVREARDRVRAAIKNSRLPFHEHRITVNLAPANIKKEGSSFDLPIAMGIWAAKTVISSDKLAEIAFVGELSLDGDVRSVNGALAMAIAAKESRIKYFVLPAANFPEITAISGIMPIPVTHLNQVRGFLEGSWAPDFSELKEKMEQPAIPAEEDDLADVKGQEQAKRALEVAAAGGHNVLMIGPPGSGKTMLARRLPGILPSLCQEEAIELTKIYSVSGLLQQGVSLIRNRPFRSPHHTTSAAGLIGGGRIPRPGEVSLAHHGVLFLDELPEFPREVLEVLRQPLEDGKVAIARAAMTLSFPARFLLISAMNPCPCGYFGDSFKACSCTPLQIQRYQSRISGPLLDRFDIQIEVPRLTEYEFEKGTRGESSEAIRQRVEKARQIQWDRFRNGTQFCNAQMNARDIKDHCQLTTESRDLLRQAAERFSLSARAYYRILKLARTIADLEALPMIQLGHLAEAIQYRCLDRKESA